MCWDRETQSVFYGLQLRGREFEYEPGPATYFHKDYYLPIADSNRAVVSY